VPELLAQEDFPPDLAGRRAVVTGAARGIGEATAKGLISSGARVVAIDKDKDVLAAAYHGLDCETVPGDLAGDDVGGPSSSDLGPPSPWRRRRAVVTRAR
jgi:NAD(P)-dependent dehydrogenase (short-subunit alcohol dehydrogenase family)